MTTKIDKFAEGLVALFKDAGAKTPKQQIALLRAGIPAAVPDVIKPWSNVTDDEGNPAVDLSSVGKAELGVAMLMTYVENGERFVLLCQSGAHYFRDKPDEEMPKRYTYPGGFGNLVECEGSSFVRARPGAEEPEQAGAREGEEEIRDADGKPIIMIDPTRCQPLDHDIVLNKDGEPIILCSEFYELNPIEVQALKGHISKLEASEEYRAACAEHTKSPASGLPEVHTVKFVSVLEAMTKVPFLHEGQETHVCRLIRHEGAMASLWASERAGQALDQKGAFGS